MILKAGMVPPCLPSEFFAASWVDVDGKQPVSAILQGLSAPALLTCSRAPCCAARCGVCRVGESLAEVQRGTAGLALSGSRASSTMRQQPAADVGRSSSLDARASAPLAAARQSLVAPFGVNLVKKAPLCVAKARRVGSLHPRLTPPTAPPSCTGRDVWTSANHVLPALRWVGCSRRSCATAL